MPPRATTQAGTPWPPGSLLFDLTEPARQRLLALGAKSQYADPGRVLIREGESSTVMFLLLTGTVKVTGATDEGDALLAIRVGGDVVGELSALDGRPRLATVTTAGPVIARVIGRAEFAGLLSRDAELAAAIARSVADKLRSATSRRIDFAGCDVTTRLARVLLDLAERYGKQATMGRTIGCPLAQTERADRAAHPAPAQGGRHRRHRLPGDDDHRHGPAPRLRVPRPWLVNAAASYAALLPTSCSSATTLPPTAANRCAMVAWPRSM
jgi:CRP-like cAMP-binding protein